MRKEGGERTRAHVQPPMKNKLLLDRKTKEKVYDSSLGYGSAHSCMQDLLYVIIVNILN